MDKIILRRSKNYTKNQEYEITGDILLRRENESNIISNIKKGDLYFTKNNGLKTEVIIENNGNIEYIKSINNITKKDNLLLLPTY